MCIRDRDTVDRLAANREYCLRPWIFNKFGSRYGAVQCITTLPSEDPEPKQTTYTTRLIPDVPDTGVVIYSHLVEPGPPRPTNLARIRVIGNAFTPYLVRFTQPRSGSIDCQAEGVTVAPGDSLNGTALNTLFGAEKPEIPIAGLALLACKLPRDTGGINTDPIPVDVTYERP